MALSYKARRRWSMIILFIGLPLYIAGVLWLISLIDRPPFWLELALYVVLGVAWIIPVRFVFLGVGKADPDE